MSPAAGTFVTSTVEFTTPGNSPLIGTPLEIRLLSSGIQVSFDNVRLTATALPVQGMVLDSGTGLVRWTPTADQIGRQNVQLSVSDGRGGTDQQPFVVNVQPEAGNHPPVIISDPITSAVVGQTYHYDVDALDPDGDQLT